MIKAILSVGFLLFMGISYGQESTKMKETRAESHYSAPTLTKEMQQYAVKNGTYIIARPKRKEATTNGEIALEKAKLVDPAAMGIKIADKTQYFEITGTTDLLVVKSTWVLDNEMKNSKK